MSRRTLFIIVLVTIFIGVSGILSVMVDFPFQISSAQSAKDK